MPAPGNELLAFHAVTSECLTSKIERWGKGKPKYCDYETLRRRLYTAISINVIGKPRDINNFIKLYSPLQKITHKGISFY